MDVNVLHARLAALFSSEELKLDEPLSAHTTFRVGGPADFFVEPHSAEQIQAAVNAAREAGAPWHVIGQGSNLLVADEGLRGLVICLGERFSAITVEGCALTAQAGATNKEVARAACEAGLTGYEFASGIPGSIGGAAYMNAGAYDGEFKDVASTLTCLDQGGQVIAVNAADAGFGYRTSAMQDRGWLVLAATLQLSPTEPDRIAERIADLTARRSAKQPLDLGSAGSTFKRPAGHYAAQLIDEAGLRGYRVGDAMVSTKHTGFVVNVGHATASQVLQVIRDVTDQVQAASGVRLEPAVRMWGFAGIDER